MRYTCKTSFLALSLLNCVISVVQTTLVTNNDQRALLDKACSSSYAIHNEEAMDQSGSPNLAYIPEGFEALYDILPEICKNLNLADLCTLKDVCSAFKGAADFELSKRAPQLRVIRVLKESMNPENSEKIGDVLKSDPKIALIFASRNRIYNHGQTYRRTNSFYQSTAHEIFSRYIQELPRCNLLYIQNPKISKNDKLITIENNEALGLFIPEVRDVKVVHESIVTGHQLKKPIVVQSMLDKLIPANIGDDNDAHGGMIIFGENSVIQDWELKDLLIQGIKEAFQKNLENFALWGSIGNYLAIPQNFPFPDPMVFGTSISGSRVKCWSLVIDQSQSEAYRKQKFLDFRSAIKFKTKKSVGLILDQKSSADSVHSSNNAEVFSNIFKGMDLVTFSHSQGPIFCIDSLSDDGSQKPQIVYEADHLCLMIISYI